MDLLYVGIWLYASASIFEVNNPSVFEKKYMQQLKVNCNQLLLLLVIHYYLVVIQCCAFAPVLRRCANKCDVIMTRHTVLLPPVQLHHVLTAHLHQPVHQTQGHKPIEHVQT